MAVLYTVGHGARPLDEFVAVLQSASLGVLIDVRRFPGSRRHPHFAREALESSLPNAGVRYEWRGETLGGRRKPATDSRHHAWRNDSFRAYADHMDSEEFRAALRELEGLVQGGTKVAVMCAETLWWKCHRRLIADAATLDGLDVIHLVGERDHQAHKLHESVRRDENGLAAYDVGATGELPLA